MILRQTLLYLVKIKKSLPVANQHWTRYQKAFIRAAFILFFLVLLNSIGSNVFHGAIDATIISSIEQVVFGVLIIVFMIYKPLGMAKLLGNIKQRFSRKR